MRQTQPQNASKHRKLGPVHLPPPTHPFRTSQSAPPERIEPLISVPNERQAQCTLVPLSCHLRLRLRSQLRAVIHLRDFVDGEVLRIDVALQFGFERGADLAQAVPLDTVEEGVTFDISGAIDTAKACGRVRDETGEMISAVDIGGCGWGGKVYLRMKCSASWPSCWSGGKLRWRCQSTILR